ncbi:tetratricopeptide repeat protein [Rubritalea marina]|uniref:tetratricopeptide repeat protein n=1 Tax=Rubritalea marina TaxID=361055 RepID=UPI00037DF081|nr:tetratricopeptide repeat protein [Rubritalea marina]
MEDTPTPIAELDHGPSKFEVFLEENQKILIAVATAIFLGVLGYVGFTSYAAMQAAQAGEALAMAEEDTALNQIISKYPGSSSSIAAELTILNQGDNKASVAQLLALYDSASNPTLKANIAAQLGLALAADGDLDRAEQVLSELVDADAAGFIAPVANLALGDIAKERGDLVAAKQFYNQVANLSIDGPTSNTEDAIISQAAQKYAGYQQIANQRLRFVEAAAPALKEPVNATTEEKSEKNSQASE